MHLCAVRADNSDVKAYADNFYQLLQNKGVEVIYDDRSVSAGVMFSDADLLGVPIRVVVSPRNLKKEILEVTSRDKKFSTTIPMRTEVEEIQRIIASFTGEAN